jgi:uncharacterized membrane protein
MSVSIVSVTSATLLLLASPALLAQSQKQAALPDCPSPALSALPNQQPHHSGALPEGTETAPTYDFHKPASNLHRTISPWQTAPPLTWQNKFHMVAKTELSPYGSITAFRAAIYEQMVGGDPKYGPGADAFGKRLGVAYLRQGTQRFLSDGVMASLLHEDPRYYRQATGSIPSRLWHAVSRTFVTKTDAGATTFNYSAWLGRAEAAGLTATYYPEASSEGHDVLTTFRSSIIGMMASDTIREFWPTWRSVLHPKEQPKGLAPQ